MTTQQVLITTDDLAHAQSLLENGQLSDMYDYLASKGDRYSTLAKGVVEGNTVSGKAVLDFMAENSMLQKIVNTSMGLSLPENIEKGINGDNKYSYIISR